MADILWIGKNGLADQLTSLLTGGRLHLVEDASETEILPSGGRHFQVIVLEAGRVPEAAGLVRQVISARHVPVIAIVEREDLARHTAELETADDFVAVPPYDPRELAVRIRRLLNETENTQAPGQIRCGDLVIDTLRCEVTVSGRQVELTFREYMLLKFLAQNPGTVHTRQALLDKVWGYDYYGGDRTVDVHIRRLRSKLESTGQSFIETVRNIGYRFKDNTQASP
ncbi:MAG: response regulator transcription factor [Dehalococcoidales bacterium]|nr:response regulator transcription factor [Dehalococcoidales bacterium]